MLMKSLTLLCLLVLAVCAETNKEIALKKGMEAVKLMDQGKLDESIKLLKEAQKIDTEEINYPYEIAYAHHLKKDTKEALRIVEGLVKKSGATERIFQMLGNLYDDQGNAEKALETYDAGLTKFPKSGPLHLEKGNVYWNKKDMDKAVPFYEKGIEVNPAFSSNYYRSARAYMGSKEKVWGIMYGEIFMNLERGSKRTQEMSELLYKTYQRSISFNSEASVGVNFCQQVFAVKETDKAKKNIELPFCNLYETNMLLSVISSKAIDIDELSKIRSLFIENYFKMSGGNPKPNILFEYQKNLQKLGHLDAYNHWLLMKGDEDGFDKWHKANPERWNAFVEWFTKNPLQIDSAHKFLREP
jgi:tetratricopeptide (TPR) repeat protein